MANAYVFPGGRLDDADMEPAILSRLDGPSDRLLLGRMTGLDSADQAGGHVVAAIRETFEEAGILLAHRDGGRLELSEPAEAERFEGRRDALNGGEISFLDLLKAEGLRLDAADMVYFAHWITPVVERRRYDARFFMARAPQSQTGRHDEIETTDSCWLSAKDALAAYETGGFTLAPPTWRILRDVAEHESLDSVLRWARGLETVPPIMPHFVNIDGNLVLALPGDELHPDATDSTAKNRVVLRDGRWWDS